MLTESSVSSADVAERRECVHRSESWKLIEEIVRVVLSTVKSDVSPSGLASFSTPTERGVRVYASDPSEEEKVTGDASAI